MLHSGSPQHRQGAGRAAHRGGPAAAAQRRPARPGPGGVPRRHAGDGRLPAGPVLGAGVRPAQPGGDDGAAAAASCGTSVPEQVPFDEPISCHHNYVAEETLRRRGRCWSPARARSGPGRATWASSRGRWAPGRTSCAGWATRTRTARPRTARAGGCRGRRRSGRSRAADLAAQTAGVECRKDAGVVDEIPGAYKDIERGDGAAGRPGRGRRPPQAGGLRQGLTADRRRGGVGAGRPPPVSGAVPARSARRGIPPCGPARDRYP